MQLLDPVSPTKFNDDVLALNPAEIAQARPQRLHPARASERGPEIHVSDASNVCWLLRVSHERPSRSTADQ